MPINYSKWDHIEVSDDEDDTHPNIDTPSLFRWRHKARVERMEEQDKKWDTYNFDLKEWQLEYKEVEQKLAASPDAENLRKQMEGLKTRKDELDKRFQELDKEKRMTPLNVDTLSQPGFSSSRVNPASLSHEDRTEELDDDKKAEKQVSFNKKWGKTIKEYGMLSKATDSLNFLIKNPDLVCDETANYLTLWCIDLAIEEKFSLMEQVSNQVISMQYILTLGKELKLDPRAAVRPFYDRLNKVNKEYMDVFNEELDAFRGRVRNRAEEKIQEAIAEHEAEERQKRLGPGGLDPVEVMEELPPDLKQCFEVQDIQMLKDTFAKYNEEDARKWLTKCVDSGLWVPSKDDLPQSAGNGDQTPGEDPPIYEVVDETKPANS